MSQADTIKFAQSNVALGPAPISKDWVIEGSPTARIRQIFRSVDGESETFIWDCTAGKFNWYYSVDETVYVIEGSVIVEDEAGVAHELTAGSTMFFPKGSAAKWHVPKYIRKVAFCRTPLTAKMQAARSIYRQLKRLVGKGASRSEAEAMFQVAPAADNTETQRGG